MMIELHDLFISLVEVNDWWFWNLQTSLVCLSFLSQHQYIYKVLHACNAYPVYRVVLE